MCLTSGGACSSAADGLTGMPGRTNCKAANTTTPATSNLPGLLIDLSSPRQIFRRLSSDSKPCGNGLSAVQASAAFLYRNLHYTRGVPTRAEQVCHNPHRTIDVAEKGLVSGAEIIQAGFSVRRMDEAVAPALPVAGESYFAFRAIPRRSGALV